MAPITHGQTIICSKTRLDGTTHEQTIICRQLFAGHVVGCRPMEGRKKLNRMTIAFLVGKAFVSKKTCTSSRLGFTAYGTASKVFGLELETWLAIAKDTA